MAGGGGPEVFVSYYKQKVILAKGIGSIWEENVLNYIMQITVFEIATEHFA